MIVVFDANVWVSGLHFAARRGIPTQALERAMTSDILATCDAIEAEVARVLIRKFKWTADRVEGALALILIGSRRVQIGGKVMGCRDERDDMVLECAMVAGAETIVSGDNDLLVLENYRGIRIVSPATYLSLP